LNFSSDGKLLTSTGDTTIRLWDTATGKEIRKREMDGELWYADFVQGGRVLACRVGATTELYLLDVPSLELRSKTAVPKEVQHLMGVFRNGKVLAGASSTDVVFWDLAAGKKLWSANFSYLPPTGSPNAPRFVRMAPDERIVAVGLDDATVSICDAASGKELRRLVDHALRYRRLSCAEFSPNGKLLAMGRGGENRLLLWDADTGELRRTICWGWQFAPPGALRGPAPAGAKLGMRFAAFSSDGKTVAVGGEDNILRLWEVATGGLRQEVRSPIWRMAFSPDDRLLATIIPISGIMTFASGTGGDRRKSVPARWRQLKSSSCGLT